MRLRSVSGLTRSVARHTLARSQTRTQRPLQFVLLPLCKYQQFVLLSFALLPGQRVPPLHPARESPRTRPGAEKTCRRCPFRQRSKLTLCQEWLFSNKAPGCHFQWMTILSTLKRVVVFVCHICHECILEYAPFPLLAAGLGLPRADAIFGRNDWRWICLGWGWGEWLMV